METAAQTASFGRDVTVECPTCDGTGALNDGQWGADCPHCGATGLVRGTGAELDAIGRDLDATGAAWEAAGYPSEGPEVDAREAVFARLHAWNEARA